MKDNKEPYNEILTIENSLEKSTEKVNITVLPSEPNVIVSNEIDFNSVTTALSSLSLELKNQQEQLKSIAEPNIADWAIVLSTIISLVVAVVALRYSVRESKQRSIEAKKIEELNHQKATADKEAEKLAIERQKLSVKPYIILQTNHSINDGIFEAYITNKGVGPAILKSFSMFVGDKKLDANMPLHAAIDSVLGNDEHEYDINAVYGLESMAISPSDSIMLYHVKLHNLDKELTNSYAVHKALTSFRYGIEYESLYGECKKEFFAAW
ncbi:hypothetical protein ACEUBB_02335 [Aeromonas rivipollensis]|uniref:hypothetical protein n=1 Tax=Aeromonas rivipollensis TaxID=948519 RepID=UPI0038D149D9